MKVFNAFISYRREDGTETAKILHEFLVEKGLKVFFDTEALIDGHRFDTQIAVALEAAPHYILIGSKEAFRFRQGEDWVRRELELALKHYHQDQQLNPDLGNRTITVLLPDGTDIPEENTLPEDLRSILKFQIISGTSGKSLERILNAVTAVTHANLWHGAHRWLEEQKQPGGRFCDCQVDENLLPTATQQLPTEVLSQHGGPYDLLEAIREESSHLYLIGQGGIGKTTALLKIMNDAYGNKSYDRNAMVPIFVELSAAPDTFGRLYQGGSSSFIRRSIYRQIRNDRSIKQVSEAAVEELDSAFTQPYETVVEPLDVLLRQERAPQYLLLLDGLNEISTVLMEETGSTVAQMVIEEILHLAKSCPNVRLVLTSRSNEQTLQSSSFTHLELAGLSEHAISQYLAQKHCNPDVSPEILEILRIPLFLIMYAEISAVDDICTQGEILHRFFSRPKTKGYTMHSRVEDVAQSVRQSASAKAKTRITPLMHSFLLDFVLPEIGWYMEEKELFHISGRQLRQVIWKVLSGREDTDICGEFGVDVFRCSNRSSATVAQNLTERLGADQQTVCERIVDLLTFTLGVLKYTQPHYTFNHQHIRDYFAARKGINALMLANYMAREDEQSLAYGYMETVFGQRPVDLVVRRFMGEILLEHRNIPTEENGRYILPALPEERDLICQALDIYRDHFPGGKGLGELVSILKDVRKNLAGCNFSRLDLSGCSLSGAVLSIGDLQADFSGALLNGESLLHTGHTSFINTVNYSDDGRWMITGGDDGRVLRYDAVTGLCSPLARLDGPVWFARILSDGILLTVCECRQRNMMLTACEKILVQRTDIHTGKTDQQLELPNEPLDVRLSHDEKLLLIRQCGLLQVVNTEDLQLLQQHTFSQQNMITEFLGNSYEVLLSDGSTVHALTGKTCQYLPLRGEDRFIWRAAVHGNTLCTMTREDTPEDQELVRLEVYRFKDKIMLHSFTQKWPSGDRWAFQLFMHNGNKYYNLVFSDQGKWLALITPNAVFLYETQEWKLRQYLPDMLGQYINDVSFLDRGQRMAIGTLDGSLCLCETAGFTPVLYSRGALCRIRDMDLSSRGQYMMTYSADNVLRCWNLQTGTLSAARTFGHKVYSSASLRRSDDLVMVKQRDCLYYTLPDLQPATDESTKEQTGYHLIHEGIGNHHPIRICKDGDSLYTVHGAQTWVLDSYLFVNGWANGFCFIACYDLPSGQPLWGNYRRNIFTLQCISSRYLITQEDENLMIYDSATGDLLGSLECPDSLTADKRLCGDYLTVCQNLGMNQHTTVYQLSKQKQVYKTTDMLRFSDDMKWVQVEKKTSYGQRQLELYYVPDRSPVASFGLPESEVPLLNGEGRTFTSIAGNRFAVCRSAEAISVYQLTEDPRPVCTLMGEYSMEPGLEIMGLDLSGLHPDSQITPQHEKTLRAYGAIL